MTDTEKLESQNDCNVFCESVMKDEHGRDILQAEIHSLIQRHIDYCKKNKVHCLILAPWGHGKSVQVAVARVAWEIGKNRNTRIKIISNNDSNAVKRVQTVGKVLKSPEYQSVFPEIKGEYGEWAKSKIAVKRDTIAIDPTLEAYGIFSGGTGGRCDYLIYDDPIDLNNTIINPAYRLKTIEMSKNVWEPRLNSNGTVIAIMTVWHKEDLAHELKRRHDYCTMEMAISEDFEGIDTTIYNAPTEYIPLVGELATVVPLWDRWDKEALKRKRESIGTLAFDRGFRQKAISPEDLMFPSFAQNVAWGVDWLQVRAAYGKNWRYFVGVDLSNKQRRGNVIAVCALDHKNIRHLVDIRTGNWSSPEVAKQLQNVDRTYNPDVFMVENNAYQQSILDWIIDKKEDYTFWSKLKPFTTGKQKLDLELGLPSLEVEFQNKGWQFYYNKKQVEPDDRSAFARMYREFVSYPSDTNDTIMAVWFVREALKHASIGGSSELAWSVTEGVDIQPDILTQDF